MLSKPHILYIFSSTRLINSIKHEHSSRILYLNNDGTSFVDHLCYFCIVFVIMSRLFIAALCSPAGKGLTFALVCDLYFCFCHLSMWYPGLGVVLNCTDF